jgi:predicted DNA-binding WGR domain protein
MMEKCFALYRYSHSDGTAKEWAIYVGSDNQEIEVRFGKAGQLSQQRLIDSTDPNAEADRRINEKINKGYRLVGQVGIDHQGRPF